MIGSLSIKYKYNNLPDYQIQYMLHIEGVINCDTLRVK